MSQVKNLLRGRSFAVGFLLFAATTSLVRAQQPAAAPAIQPAGEHALTAPPVPGQDVLAQPSVVHKVIGPTDRVELLVNTSRILQLDQKIPQAQVNNPDLLDMVALSPNQVQISARKPGVTQVNLWSESKQIYTVDVIVIGDARELSLMLRTQFPKTALQVTPVGGSVLISGYVDQPTAVPKIIQIAEQYYPKPATVINNMTVSGVQHGLLHVKVMEVSRTKLRDLGFDFTALNSAGATLIQQSQIAASPAFPTSTLTFNTMRNGSTAFEGVLAALAQDSLAKILSEPDLVADSGRPAYMLVGGEIGYVINNGTAGNSAGFKEYGTRLDFVPIILGNGKLHLDVRARVSSVDAANSTQGVPSIKTREVETGVELHAGQTLAICGLVEQIVDASTSGLPWIRDVPYLGAPFRTVSEKTNEVELLIMVTPEIVDAMDASRVPPCGPGSETTSPSDWELYMKGHLEVPKCCPIGDVAGCGQAAGNTTARYNPHDPNSPSAPDLRGAVAQTNISQPAPGFIGPLGYDVLK